MGNLPTPSPLSEVQHHAESIPLLKKYPRRSRGITSGAPIHPLLSRTLCSERKEVKLVERLQDNQQNRNYIMYDTAASHKRKHTRIR